METVIVTYRQDLPRAVRAVQSIDRYTIGTKPNTIHVVINDSPDVFACAQTLLKPHADVYHYTDISTWTHARSGWWSQQWLKLQAHQLISGEWYMPFDSDMYIDRCIKQTELFDGNHACCNLRDRDTYNNNPKFSAYIDSACEYWKVDPDELCQILRESPPNILHRTTVKNMLSEMSPWIFGSVENPSLEFFVYWVYVYKNNLTHLYRHQDNWFWFGTAFHMDNR